MTTAEKIYTLDEFNALPREMTQGCELLDGRIVRKHVWDGEEEGMTPEMYGHAEIVRLIWLALERAIHELPQRRVFAEPTFHVGAARNRTRRPDLALIVGDSPTGAEAILDLVPAIAVEVVSPNNSAADMFAKVEEYIAAGVQLVWVVYPQSRTVAAYRPDRTVVFRTDDTITAEPVLPDFSRPVADLFPVPSPAPNG